MMIAYIKVFHIVFMVAWYAGLFYLPRLFVYHAMTTDRATSETFKVMERKLYYGIMMPSLILTIALGIWLWVLYGFGFDYTWMNVKFALVTVLVAHHFYLGKLMIDFREDRNRHGHVFYRWLNEIPALPILVAVVMLVVLKP